MLHLIKYFLFLFLIPSSFFPQTITSINFSGNRNIDKETLTLWSGISTGIKTFPCILDSVENNIISGLSAAGFYHSNFTGKSIEFSDDSLKVKINIDLYEGNPTYIHNILFENADSLDSAEVIPQFEFLKGEIFNSFFVEENISQVLTFYENEGYPYAKIVIQSVYLFTDSLENQHFADLHLKIVKEQKSRIDKIEIEGNSVTKEYVILRELRIKPGEIYSQKLVEELPKRLNRLRYFEPVDDPEFFINSKNEGVLLIKVKEKQTNNFDGIVGYIPPASVNEKGYLTGLVNINLRNLFGTGRAAAIRWQQFNRFSQELELRYLEPWILNYPFNIGGGFYQRKQDTTYIQRKVNGSVEFLATENISTAFFIETDRIIPAINENNFFSVFNSNALTTGINLKVDNRDDPYAPTEGFLVINSYSFSRKKIYGPQQYITSDIETNINLQRIMLDMFGYYEIFKRNVIALGVHGRELRGSFFENSDLFRLGGTNTLRGYREDQFLGSRIFWSNLEYRLLLSPRSFAFIFFDTGYYLRNEDQQRNILKQEDFKVGYGLGLNIETGVGVLGVSFALAEGDSFSDGKIHFGIINEF